MIAKKVISREQIRKMIKGYAKMFKEVRETIGEYCVNQDAMIEMMCLAVVSKQHCMSVGPWGCNKTRAINTFAHLVGVGNGNMFRVTLDKNTPPEALLGPISPKQLLENDRFVRNLEGTICDKPFAFIGEAFSGNSATRRALHTVLNERTVENGGELVRVKLHTAFLDSNELPSRREDRPFYDRILYRLQVGYLDPTDKEAFLRMRNSPEFRPSKVQPVMTMKDVEMVNKLCNYVTVPRIIDDAMHTIHSDLYTKNITLSDRRWYNAYKALRAAAVLDGRDVVTPGDICALRYVLVEYVDGAHSVIEETLRSYKGQSIRDAEQSYVNDARALLDQAMQGNDDMKATCLLGMNNLREQSIDADTVQEIDALIDQLRRVQDGGNNASGFDNDGVDISDDDDVSVQLDSLLSGAHDAGASGPVYDDAFSDDMEEDDEAKQEREYNV